MTQNDQIDILNGSVKATLRPSKINGVGVFAIRDIRKNEKIYCDKLPDIYYISYGNLNKLLPEIRKIILERWPSIINGSKFISPDARLISFMNHQEADECNYSQVSDTAKRDIPAGTEITENYKLMPKWETIFPWLVDNEKV